MELIRTRRATSVGRTHAVRAGHARQRGLTLTEMLVVIAALALIAGSIAGAFSIGLRLLGPGGAESRLTGSHDLLAFEQQIGADVARSVCLAAPGQTSLPTATGACGASVRKTPSTCPSGYLLCLAYYVPGSTTCHTITYSQGSGAVVVRADASTGKAGRFTTGGLGMTASWSAATINDYSWTKAVVVSVTQQGTPGAPTSHWAAATYHLVPLVADPASPVSGGTSPC